MGKIGTGGGVETASFGQDGLTNKKWLYDQTDKKTKDNSAIKSPYDRIKFESEQRNSDQKGRPPVSGMENL